MIFLKPSKKKPYHYYQNGWIDLALLAKNLLHIPAPGATNINPLGSNHGLNSLSAIFLHQSFEKNFDWTEDWSGELSKKQIEYAALDAIATYRIAKKIFQKCTKDIVEIPSGKLFTATLNVYSH